MQTHIAIPYIVEHLTMPCAHRFHYIAMKGMSHKHLLLLFILLTLGNPLFAEYFRHISLPEGLTQPSVMAIHQDRLGRMWFGTREGVNRYDGKRITAFKGWVNSPGMDSSIWLGNDVSSITENKQGDIFLLIDNTIVKYDMQTEEFHQLPTQNDVQVLTSFKGEVWYMKADSLFCYQADTGESLLKLKTNLKTNITCLTLLSDKICIGTHQGAVLIDRTSHRQTRILDGIEVYRIFESSQKELWLGTRMNGLYRMNAKGKVIQVPYSPHSSEGISSWQIRDFVEDEEHNVWFGTFDGLQKYNHKTGKYSLIQIPKYIGGLNHPSIFALYKDVQGTIWVGSYFGGVNYFTPKLESFIHYDYDQNATKDLYYSYISDVLVDKDEQIWLGTDGGGVICIDKNWNIIHQFTASNPNSLLHNNIKSISYDKKNECLYIGTYLGGLSRYDMRTGKFHNYLKSYSAEKEAPNEVVYHVQMRGDSLYLSARNGLFLLDTKTQQFHKLKKSSLYIEHMDIDPEGQMYLGGWGYFTVVPPKDTEKSFQVSLSHKNSRATVTCIKATNEGAYIGTLGAGLFFYNKKTREISHYTTEEYQLPSNYCYNIKISPNGNILITSEKGITSYSPKEGSFATINLMENVSSTYIINGCGLFISDYNQVFVGNTKGVTTFAEEEFHKADISYNMPKLYFSNLWVNNQVIAPKDESGILTHALPYTHTLQLDHDQNNLILSFALPDYKQQLSKKQFRYKLEGFDKKWIKTNQPEIHYTNLAPGTYTLRVATIVNNAQGAEMTGLENSIDIIIATPWYATWWAWTFYIITFIGCIYYYISSKVAKRTLALSLEKERFEKQQIELLNQEKLVFFTNVSHEFRTPLTLIISHIDILLQKSSLPPSLYNQIFKIRKHAQHLSNLISELLEFRKLEQNHKVLQIAEQDIISLLKEVYFSFVDYAHSRNITYTFNLTDTEVKCWFDAQLLEKVFFNLLSNAFKYTPNNGSITVSSKIGQKGIEIYISDTGTGIAEHEVSRIFERFFQASNSKMNGQSASGTGIGLALSKSIIEKHHGSISVESTLSKGSTFTVRLPKIGNPFQGDPNVQLVSQPSDTPVIPGSLVPLPEVNNDTMEPESMEDSDEKSHVILLVEDNEELLQLLNELFSPFYETICAQNGEEGLQQLYSNKIDLIISDIMMPNMSGTEMCLQIKNNIDFCHIPIILLTALNSTEQNIEGLNRGADDYITKPFHAQLLLARANNLIRSRLLMQHQFNKKPISEIDLTSVNPLDKDLLKRTSQIIEQHIDDTEFDIPILCRELGIGRSLLYTKFKALTGMTPNNFILSSRLKHAATLLKTQVDKPISEICDECGFNSPIYFSQRFKKQFNTTPQLYRKKAMSQE